MWLFMNKNGGRELRRQNRCTGICSIENSWRWIWLECNEKVCYYTRSSFLLIFCHSEKEGNQKMTTRKEIGSSVKDKADYAYKQLSSIVFDNNPISM